MRGIVADLGRTDYREALSLQRRLNRARNDGKIPDVIILNEHEDVYTVGIHRNPEELVDPRLKPIEVERGGSVTYHGPGQIVVYFVLNLLERKTNVKEIIISVQSAVAEVLAFYGIEAEGRLGKETGIWISGKKICSIGFAIRESSTLHGIALNVTTDLQSFDKIMPCGFSSAVMTSMEKETGYPPDFSKVKYQLRDKLLKHLKITEIEELKDMVSLSRLI